MSKLKGMFDNSKSIEEYSKDYSNYLHSILQKVDVKSVSAFVGILLKARQNGRRIFFMGNGGSASTASHFAADLCKNVSPDTKYKFRTISLVDNSALTTALANDLGYENIFVEQLSAVMEEGDVVVGISASGNSKNILKAVEYANSNGGITIGIVGFDGGQLKKEAMHCIHFPSYNGEYGPVEDAHIILNHIIVTYLSFSKK